MDEWEYYRYNLHRALSSEYADESAGLCLGEFSSNFLEN